MSKHTFWSVTLLGMVAIMALLMPEFALAQVGGFESKVSNLNSNLVSKLLPLVSTCGLLYGVFLMVTGSGEAKGKILAVIGGSIIGFLAPALMGWLSSAF